MNWKQAFALGLCSFGAYAGDKEESSMYLYGGVVLPKLPEWDRAKYPYAVIRKSGEYVCYLYLSKVEPYHTVRTDGNAYIMVGSGTDGDVLVYSLIGESTNEDWTGGSEDNGVYFTPDELAWTNHNVLGEDGLVYLKATDPVSVGNGMMGYGGAVLPKLPEWDKTKYPYAHWHTIALDSGVCALFTYDVRPVISANGWLTFKEPTTIRRRVAVYDSNVGGFVWESDNWIEENVAAGDEYFPPSWVNFDLLNEDGTLYLAATAPIPVYE